MSSTVTLQGCTASKKADLTVSATVATLDRVIYATVDGRARDFERVGTDASGNAIYRDQNR